MKRTRKGISAKLVVVALLGISGLIACPLQALYCVVLSGKQTSKHEIVVGQPVTVSLSPDMNPIRFVAWLDHEVPRIIRGTAEITSFNTTLSQGQKELWSEKLSVSVRKSDNKDTGSGITIGSGRRSNLRTNIHTFEIENAGDYEFLVTRGNRNQLDVGDIQLNVRQNIRKVNIPVAIAGGILLLLGVGVGAFSFMGKGSQTSEA